MGQSYAIVSPSLNDFGDMFFPEPNESEPKIESEIVPIGVAQVHATEAWGKSTGKGAKLGMLSTGIDIEHEDIKSNLKGCRSFVGDDDPTDSGERGTFEGGLMAASRNGIGVVGVSPDVALYSAKCLKDEAAFSPDEFITALHWCETIGADVVYIPFSWREPNERLRSACDRLAEAGILIVGFQKSYQGNEIFPGSWPSVLSTGPQFLASYNDAELYAWTGSMYCTLPGRYGMSGRGWWAAGALVSAAACLLKSLHPGISAHEIRQHLVRTGDLIPAVGARKVNAQRAVETDL